MKVYLKKLLSLVLSLAMAVTIMVPITNQEVQAASQYKGYAAIGDSVSTGYGPLLNDWTWEHYYFETAAGAYPQLVRRTMGLSTDQYHSLTTVALRTTDVYYALGGNPDLSTIGLEEDYLEEAIDYHRHNGNTLYTDKLTEMHNGEGANRIKNSDVVTIEVGNIDLMIYPAEHANDENGEFSLDIMLENIQQGLKQYTTFYPKIIQQIRSINPNAKILLLSNYNPYTKIIPGDEDGQTIANALNSSIVAVNSLMKVWAAMYANTTYVEISGVSSYIDEKETQTTDVENYISKLLSHENHPGALGHQYIAEQINKALNIGNATAIPDLDTSVSYLAFSSDIHTNNKETSLDRLDNWLTGVSSKLGNITFDQFSVTGDMASANDGFSSKTYWGKVANLMYTVENNGHVRSGIYTTGNHEYSPGKWNDMDHTIEPYNKVTRLGEAANEDHYSIYCFGAAQYNQQFNDDDIAALAAYLDSADSTKPVFVLSHFPLHTYKSRVSGNAKAVIDVLNEHSNVIFLWGHNHTESDTHYDQVYSGNLDGTPINFIYASAGCMSDSEYSTGSDSVSGKGLVATLDGDDTLTLAYYDENYEVVRSYDVDIYDGSAIQTNVEEINLDPNFDVDTNKYISTEGFEDGGKYIITVNDQAMNNLDHTGYVTINNSITYTYTGLQANQVAIRNGKVVGGAVEGNVFTAKKVSNGYTLQDASGKYLTATYIKNGGASIQLEESAESNAVWTISNGQMKHVSTGKYVNYEIDKDVDGTKQSGETKLYDIRSDADDVVVIYKQVDVNYNEEENKTDYRLISTIKDGKWYAITAIDSQDGNTYALGNGNHDGYKNTNGSSKYSYSGLVGQKVTTSAKYIQSDVSANALWKAVAVDDGFVFVNSQGGYLNSSYTKDSTYTGIGTLTIGTDMEVWTYSSGSLVSKTSGKYLNYQSAKDIDGTRNSGSADFFTIRSSSKDTIKFYEAVNFSNTLSDATVDDTQFTQLQAQKTYQYQLVTSNEIEDGASYVIAYDQYAMIASSDEGYRNKDNSDKYYHYSGRAAKNIGVIVNDNQTTLPASLVSEDMLWTFVKSGDGYTIQDQVGNYLNASYVKSVVDGEITYTGVGDIALSEVADIWTTSYNGSDKHTGLKSTNSGKILTMNLNKDVTGTKLFPEGDVEVFTVRSSQTHSIYLYKKVEVMDTSISEGEYVIVSADNFAVSCNANEGYVDKNSAYIYKGFDAMKVSLADEAITSVVTKDMVWKVTPVEGGYTLQNSEGKYLNSYYDKNDVIKVFLSDTPEVWTYVSGKLTGTASTKQLSHETNSATASVFTLRSSGQTFTFYEASPTNTTTIKYMTSGDGSVSVNKEVIQEGNSPIGSTAMAATGYEFISWSDEAGNVVSNEATFIPSSSAKATYYANFDKIKVTFNYEVKTIGNGVGGSVTNPTETVYAIDGVVEGSKAVANEGYAFAYWTSDVEGNNVIRTIDTISPKKVNGAYTGGTYYAWFKQNAECVGTKLVEDSLSQGLHHLVINDVDLGEFYFTKDGDYWTIYSIAKKQYVSLVSKKLTYSSTAYPWRYNGTQFYTGATSPFLVVFTVRSTYYLTVNSSKALTSNTTKPKSVKLLTAVEFNNLEHELEYTTNKDDHTYTCKECGLTGNEAHSFNEQGFCICGYDANHTHDYVLVSSTATCIAGGIGTYECPICKDTYQEEVGQAGHSFDPAKHTERKPTYSSTGYTSDYCMVCKKTIKVTIPKLVYTSVASATITINQATSGKVVASDITVTLNGKVLPTNSYTLTLPRTIKKGATITVKIAGKTSAGYNGSKSISYVVQ